MPRYIVKYWVDGLPLETEPFEAADDLAAAQQVTEILHAAGCPSAPSVLSVIDE